MGRGLLSREFITTYPPWNHHPREIDVFCEGKKTNAEKTPQKWDGFLHQGAALSKSCSTASKSRSSAMGFGF